MSAQNPRGTHHIVVRVVAGAGGEEAQACAQILRAMYVGWAERKGLRYESKGDTVEVDGAPSDALDGEVGIHRLVRVSPFDPKGRRHTSFAAVEVNGESDYGSTDATIPLLVEFNRAKDIHGLHQEEAQNS